MMNTKKSSSYHYTVDLDSAKPSCISKNQVLDDAYEKLSSHKNSFFNQQTEFKSRNVSIGCIVRPPLHSHSQSQSQDSEILNNSNAELLAKLYNSNRNLENTLVKLNLVSKDLNNKEEDLLKAETEIKAQKRLIEELKDVLRKQQKENKELKNKMLLNDERQKEDSFSQIKFTQSKLAQQAQYNDQLFQDYQKILKHNFQQQTQIMEYQEEIVRLKEQLAFKQDLILQNDINIENAVKKMEHKVTWIEQDLERIEEKQYSIPEISRRLRKRKSRAAGSYRLEEIENYQDN